MSARAITFCGLTAVHPQDRDQYHSLCFAYLAAYARRALPQVETVVVRDAREAVASRPDLVGVSASSLNIKQAIAVAESVRRASPAPLLLGGIHISALPHTLPEPFDIGVVGEGEQTFLDLLRLFQQTGRLDAGELHRIPGLVFRDEGRIVQTPLRPPLPDLSVLPLPDRSILRGDWTKAHMVSSRGCPYHCRFCSSRRFWGGYRAFPAQNVLAEIDDLVQNYSAGEIHFFDDLFVADAKRLAAIADGVVERGYAGKVQFSCTLRAELADESMFAQLARMQVKRFTFGAESASPRVLAWLKGESARVEANQRTLDLARRYGMTCSPSFIKGAPGETGDDLLATYEFILRGIRNRAIDYFEVHCLTPFPGTEVWDLARERGLVADDMDFDELRIPWERLYMNEAMPKTSFYFFENLDRLGRRWLGMSKRRLIGIVDVSHGAERLDELVGQLGQHGILDGCEIVAFHGDVDLDDLRGRGHDAGGQERLDKYLAGEDSGDIFVYLRPEEGIDVQVVNNLIWWHFDHPADLTVTSGYRHFTLESPFAISLAVGNLRGLRAGLQVFGVESDPLAALKRKGITVAVYRPDEDPFAQRTTVARLFTEMLQRDFGIDRPWPGREKMWSAVEERIVTDARRMPQRELRRRRLRKFVESLRALRQRWRLKRG